MTKRGKFIVFEGLDGSGSTTHTELLHKRLQELGIGSIITKEPTNNIIGGAIRGILTKEWHISMHGLQLLFSADRAHHLERLIIPTLNEGTNVICDRYMYSTIAYGSSGDVSSDWLKEMNKYFLKPDLVLLLKVSPNECIKRISLGRAEFELFEKVEKLQNVWKEYEKLAEENNFFKIIEGENEKELVAEKILEEVKKIIK